jgi:hypothetical protein
MDIKDIYSFFTMKLPIFNKGFLESHSIFKSPFLIQLNINIHQYHKSICLIQTIKQRRFSGIDAHLNLKKRVLSIHLPIHKLELK